MNVGCWLICIVMILSYTKCGDDLYLLVSALFAIAGSIGSVAEALKGKKYD